MLNRQAVCPHENGGGLAYGVRRLLMAYEMRPYFFLFQPHEIDMLTTN